MARNIPLTPRTLEILQKLTVHSVDASLGVAGVRIEEKLPPAEYAQIKKVIKALGGEWNRKEDTHLFPTDPVDAIDAVVMSGVLATTLTPDQLTGFFPTPVRLAAQIVEEAVVRRDSHVLEPSAGSGRLVDAILAAHPKTTCVAVEWDPKRRAVLQAYAATHGRLHVAEAADFMACASLERAFTHVVMNPAFLRVGLGNHLDHVRRAFDLLVPNGVLRCILPNGVKFRGDQRHLAFRAWVREHRGEIADLPPGSFEESSTGIQTVLLKMRK